MKTNFAWAVVLFGIVSVIQAVATDCSVSKKFHLRRPQVLAGIFQDPNNATLPGIGVELLSGTKIVQHLQTNNQGAYDFGTVPAGKYRIHIRYGESAFCAPTVQCGNQGCTVLPKLAINPKNTVIVH